MLLNRLLSMLNIVVVYMISKYQSFLDNSMSVYKHAENRADIFPTNCREINFLWLFFNEEKKVKS